MKLIRNCSIILGLILLMACSEGPDEAVKIFIEKTKKRTSKDIPPLTDFPTYEPLLYSAKNLRDPFEPASTLSERPSVTMREGPSPNLNRTPEALESYHLDSLLMVGTLSRNQEVFALIKDSAGIIHRVKLGNYMGHNFGCVEKISDSEIHLQEWMFDATRGWRTREVVMRLLK